MGWTHTQQDAGKSVQDLWTQQTSASHEWWYYWNVRSCCVGHTLLSTPTTDRRRSRRTFSTHFEIFRRRRNLLFQFRFQIFQRRVGIFSHFFLCCLYFILKVHVNFSSVFYRAVVWSSRHRPFCFHNSCYQKYATRVSVCVIAVRKSQEFLLKVRRLSLFFSTTTPTPSRRRVVIFSTTTQGIRLRRWVDVFFRRRRTLWSINVYKQDKPTRRLSSPVRISSIITRQCAFQLPAKSLSTHRAIQQKEFPVVCEVAHRLLRCLQTAHVVASLSAVELIITDIRCQLSAANHSTDSWRIQGDLAKLKNVHIVKTTASMPINPAQW